VDNVNQPLPGARTDLDLRTAALNVKLDRNRITTS
jgi:hypothetical protein